MIRKGVVLFVAVMNFLVPCSVSLIKNTNVTCQCGCREWPCYCCSASENSCGGTSVGKGNCKIHDESDLQPPATLAHAPVMGFPLDRMGYIAHPNNDLTSPGYRDPPMKPPPTA